jgi:hypothetical protein
MTEVANHVDWEYVKKILNEVLVPLQTVCAMLPNGLPKTICCGVVAGLQALIAMLPNS